MKTYIITGRSKGFMPIAVVWVDSISVSYSQAFDRARIYQSRKEALTRLPLCQAHYKGIEWKVEQTPAWVEVSK